MHTKHVLENLVEDLHQVSVILCDLASSSEFQEKRTEYLSYYDDIVEIKEELKKDISKVKDYESYTGTLDRI